MMIDRLSMQIRPSGWPIMYQTWDTLLFLHWPVAAELLRPLMAPRLVLDTFEGRAWVSVAPFTMWGIRPIFLPPLPVVSQSHELNVRTYVRACGWCAGGLVLLARCFQRARCLGGTLGLRASVFSGAYAIAGAPCGSPCHVHPRPSRGASGSIRWHMVARRPAVLAGAGHAGFFSCRALLPVYYLAKPPLSCAYLSSSLATAPRRTTLLHLNHAGISWLTDPNGAPTGARAERTAPGRHLASRAALT